MADSAEKQYEASIREAAKYDSGLSLVEKSAFQMSNALGFIEGITNVGSSTCTAAEQVRQVKAVLAALKVVREEGRDGG